MLEIKRNIFESSGKMPGSYEPVGPPMTRTDTNSCHTSVNSQLDSNVRHARSPRVGEQK